jgi:hypothetical protein
MSAKNLAEHADGLQATEAKKKSFPGVPSTSRVWAQLPPGLTFDKLVRSMDVKGRYRRPSVDANNKPTGDHDEMVLSTRHHMTTIGKGFELVELVPDERASTSIDAPTAPIKF